MSDVNNYADRGECYHPGPIDGHGAHTKKYGPSVLDVAVTLIQRVLRSL